MRVGVEGQGFRPGAISEELKGSRPIQRNEEAGRKTGNMGGNAGDSSRPFLDGDGSFFIAQELLIAVHLIGVVSTGRCRYQVDRLAWNLYTQKRKNGGIIYENTGQ